MEVQTPTRARLRRGPSHACPERTGPRRERGDDGHVGRRGPAVEGRGRDHEVAEACGARGRVLLRQHVHGAGDGGFVDVAARLPGDITTHEVSPGQALFIQKGSWLANDVNVKIDTQWGGFKNLFGGEGGFIIRAEGQGLAVFACYGALEVWTLQAGQTITIDTGHMVAYEDTIQMQMRKASGGGLVQSFKSGEGFVFDFSGPGRVWTQTRNPNELMGWIQSFVGTGNSSGSSLGGAFGGLLGRD